MSVSVSLTDTDVFAAVRTFLLAIVPAGTEVVQAQDNRVPMPRGGFISMNSTAIKRLGTNVDTFKDPGTNPGTRAVETDVQITLQLDFYGAASLQWATMTQALFRDEAGVNLFPPNVVPLYADDPQQVPLINGEQQYETRWRVQAALQFNPVTTIGQDFAGALTITPKPVDTTFKP